MNMLGVILAGGQSRRMSSRDKAGLNFEGRTFLQRAQDRFQGTCTRILLSGRQVEGLRHLDDPEPDQGPMGAFAAIGALLESEPQWELIALSPIDMPRFPEQGYWLLEQSLQQHPDAGACIVRNGDRIFPLTGIYRPAAIAHMRRAYLAGERQVWQLLRDLDICHAQVPQYWVANVNTPEDYQDLIRHSSRTH